MKEALRWSKAKVRECRIKQKGGRWFASVLMHVPDEKLRCGNGICGIDLGVKTFATIYFDDGRMAKIDAPRPLRRLLGQLRRAQQALARKKRGSVNRGKAKRRVAKLMYRISCIRKDFLHKLSHALCAAVDLVRLETLSLVGWMKLWGRVVGDLAPYEFIRQLQYKMAWRGGKAERVDRSYPSSKLCSWSEKAAKSPHEQREWVLIVMICSYRIGIGVVLSVVLNTTRDINAARNLLQWKPTSGVTLSAQAAKSQRKPTSGVTRFQPVESSWVASSMKQEQDAVAISDSSR